MYKCRHCEKPYDGPNGFRPCGCQDSEPRRQEHDDVLRAAGIQSDAREYPTEHSDIMREILGHG